MEIPDELKDTFGEKLKKLCKDSYEQGMLNCLESLIDVLRDGKIPYITWEMLEESKKTVKNKS